MIKRKGTETIKVYDKLISTLSFDKDKFILINKPWFKQNMEKYNLTDLNNNNDFPYALNYLVLLEELNVQIVLKEEIIKIIDEVRVNDKLDVIVDYLMNVFPNEVWDLPYQEKFKENLMNVFKSQNIRL